MLQDIVDDRNDVGQAFARACARGEDIAVALDSQADRFVLVTVELQWITRRLLARLATAENALAEGMEQTLVYQLFDGGTRLEARIELDERVWPEKSTLKFLRDIVANLGITNLEKASDIGSVVADQMLAQLEDVHHGLPESLPVAPIISSKSPRSKGC